jgi:WhiB family redox-sensing transcriptional regulator
MSCAQDVRPAGATRLLEVERMLPCQGPDAPLFFAAEPERLEQAKALCARCPVRAACLAGALERQEPWGVWGGEVFESGRVIERKRRRGRPRKASAA